MMFSKKSPHKPACLVTHIVVGALLFLASIAALLGVYMSHVLSTGLTFGTSSGSLSLIAFAICVMAFGKQMKACAGKCDMCSGK